MRLWPRRRRHGMAEWPQRFYQSHLGGYFRHERVGFNAASAGPDNETPIARVPADLGRELADKAQHFIQYATDWNNAPLAQVDSQERIGRFHRYRNAQNDLEAAL